MAHGDSKRGSLTVVVRRMSNLLTFGFRGRHGSQMKRLVLCQVLVIGFFVYIWYHFSAVVWPKLLGNKSKPLTPDINLLDYFLSAQHDGAKITWAHGVNSRTSLIEALSSDVMVIEGDVILKGQDTNDQQLVPVMSHPPLVNSDILLVEWLDLIKHHKKAFKLDFKSSESVELSLQTLQKLQENLHVPIHLSAAILNGANAHLSLEKTVDALQFIRLCSTLFPQSTIALGWVTGRQGQNKGDGERYNWTDVKMMNDVLEKSPISQPLTFNVRAGFARKSVSQLKWLLEMTRATLTVISSDNDNVPIADLLYIRHKFPKHSIFYDLPSALQTEFNRVGNKDADEKPKAMLNDEALAFNSDEWKVVRSQEGETIYLGSQSVLLQTGLLLTKNEYIASNTNPVRIQGRVEFLNFDSGDGEDPSRAPVGFSVFLRVTQSSRPDSISGIRCFMGVKGLIKIETRGVPGAEAEQQAVLPGSAPCFAFKLADYGEEIKLNVMRPKQCNDRNNLDFESTVTFSMKEITTHSWYIAIKQSVPIGFTAVDQFIIYRPQNA